MYSNLPSNFNSINMITLGQIFGLYTFFLNGDLWSNNKTSKKDVYVIASYLYL